MVDPETARKILTRQVWIFRFAGVVLLALLLSTPCSDGMPIKMSLAWQGALVCYCFLKQRQAKLFLLTVPKVEDENH